MTDYNPAGDAGAPPIGCPNCIPFSGADITEPVSDRQAQGDDPALERIANELARLNNNLEAMMYREHNSFGYEVAGLRTYEQND